MEGRILADCDILNTIDCNAIHRHCIAQAFNVKSIRIGPPINDAIPATGGLPIIDNTQIVSSQPKNTLLRQTKLKLHTGYSVNSILSTVQLPWSPQP